MRSGGKNRKKKWLTMHLPIAFFCLLLSLIAHFFLLSHIRKAQNSPKSWAQKKKPVTIKILTQKKSKDNAKEKKEPDKNETERILEALQKPTLEPENAKFLGQFNHKTSKEVKAKRQFTKAMDPGEKVATGAKEVQKTPSQQKIPSSDSSQNIAEKTAQASKFGTKVKQGLKALLKLGSAEPKEARNEKKSVKNYKDLVNSTLSDSYQNQVQIGYQDYVHDQLLEAEAVDLNTKEYRFIGYFTGLRKAIELVWNYPSSAARKGQTGSVSLYFTILKSGHLSEVKVLASSGYGQLDKAIVDAIELAAPFAPLPTGFGRNELRVTGTFNYVLR